MKLIEIQGKRDLMEKINVRGNMYLHKLTFNCSGERGKIVKGTLFYLKYGRNCQEPRFINRY